MLIFIVSFHVLFAALLIVIILMQQSHGAGMSSVFGGGGSGSFFGGRGASPLLMKITIILAVLFFLTSTSIAIVVPKQSRSGDFQDELMKALPENRGIPMEEELYEPAQENEGKGEQFMPTEEELPELPVQQGGN